MNWYTNDRGVIPFESADWRSATKAGQSAGLIEIVGTSSDGQRRNVENRALVLRRDELVLAPTAETKLGFVWEETRRAFDFGHVDASFKANKTNIIYLYQWIISISHFSHYLH